MNRAEWLPAIARGIAHRLEVCKEHPRPSCCSFCRIPRSSTAPASFPI